MGQLGQMKPGVPFSNREASPALRIVVCIDKNPFEIEGYDREYRCQAQGASAVRKVVPSSLPIISHTVQATWTRGTCEALSLGNSRLTGAGQGCQFR